MGLATDEKRLLAWYRTLVRLEMLSLHSYLLTGDTRLIMWLAPSSAVMRRYRYKALAEPRQDDMPTQPVATVR